MIRVNPNSVVPSALLARLVDDQFAGLFEACR